MKVLFINTYDPFIEKHGGALLSRTELNALKSLYDVETIFGTPLVRRFRNINYFRLLFDLFNGRSLKESSYNILARPKDFYTRFDLIWCNHDFSAYDYKVFQELNIPFVIRKHNIEHLFYRNDNFLICLERKRIFSFEKKLGLLAKKVLYLSYKEFELDNYSRNKIYLAPLLKVSKAGGFLEYSFSNRPIDILCISNFNWKPNKVGIEWFIKKVLPNLPIDTKIHLVGVGSFIYSDGIRIFGHGFVDNLDILIKKSKIFISPILSGAGIKIKTINALVAGLPIVSTSVGVEGIATNSNDLPASIGNDAVSFSNQIIKLLSNEKLCKKMSFEALIWSASMIDEREWLVNIAENVFYHVTRIND